MLPADGTLTNGLGKFSVTLVSSGNQTIRATDTVSGTISGVSGTIATAAAAIVVDPPIPTANADTFVLGPGGPASGVRRDERAGQRRFGGQSTSEARGDSCRFYNPRQLEVRPEWLLHLYARLDVSGNRPLHLPSERERGVRQPVTDTILSYNASLVDKLYHQVLHRSAEDDPGLVGWTGLLDQGIPLDVVAKSIFNSPERLDPLVNQFYVQYLDRPAEPAGITAWVAAWQKDGDPDDLEADILSSQEFYNDAGDTVDGFVRLIYNRLLLRQADPNGLMDWEAALKSGQLTRKQVAADFLNSPELHADVVGFLFGEYFGNPNPTPALAQPYVTDLNNGLTRTQVELEIINSMEYKDAPPEPAAGKVGIALYSR